MHYILKSPTFYLYGSREKWWLEIFSFGTENVTEPVTYLRLYKEASKTEYKVDFKMGIKNTDGSDFISREMIKTFVTMRDYGEFTFKRSKLTNIASDGNLIVFCEPVIILEQTMIFSAEASTHIPAATEKYLSQMSLSKTTIESASQTSPFEGVSILIENFKNLYLSKQSADIKITVKGREFLAHTHILTARSKVFSSMFNNDMVERNSSIVEITDCDPDSFEDFLLFLYTGNLEVVSSRNAVNLYKTADKYDLKELKGECVRCMINEMNLDSFCDVISLATVYDETEIVIAATKFFIANAKSILLTTKWTNFIADNLSLSNELFLKFVDEHKK